VCLFADITKPPGMQASINRCLSQARINWEGYAAGRASGVIWGGFGDGGTVSFGWGGVHRDCRCLCLHYLPWGGYGGGGDVGSGGLAPTRTVGSSVSIIFPGSTKIQKIFTMACNNIFGFNPVNPWAPPHAYINRRWGNPA